MRYSQAIVTSCLVSVLAIMFPYRPVLAGETSDSPPPVLYLQTEFVSDYPENRRRNLLGRELFRQAILVAARDELGILTVDQTLRESPPEHAKVIHLFLRERTKSNGRWRVQLFAYEGDDEDEEPIWKTLWKKDYDYDDERYALYADIVPKLERDTRDEIVEVLLSAGFSKKQPVEEPSQAAAEDPTEDMLSKIDFIAQFGVVRWAHQAIAANGETPELLGILVRGYANLGLLTQHQYNAVGDVFIARSWLYAQRMMIATEQSDLARWHRAYAWALGGTLQHGLTDLGQLKPSSPDNEETLDPAETEALPLWTKLIEPYCRSDRAATKEIGEQVEVLKPWATRLWFELTSSYQHDLWTYHAGIEVAELTPTAYGVYAEMSRPGGRLGTIRYAAYHAPQAFEENFPSSLAAVPGLPEIVQEFLPTSELKRILFRGIFKDPDTHDPFTAATNFIAEHLREESQQTPSGDPSWSVLAYLLEEEQFVQISNYLDIATNATEHSLEDQVNAVYPLVEKHRYAGYIDTFRYNRRHEVEEIEQAIEGMAIEDPRGNMRRMFRQTWSVADRDGRGIGRRASRNRARDYTMKGMLDHYFPTSFKWESSDTSIASRNIEAFNKIMPYSDLGVRFSIHTAKDPTAGMLELWEEQLTEDATAYTNLGKRYLTLKDRDGAARCFEKSVKILPTVESVRSLANLHWQKDFSRWERVHLDFLESEDTGLKNAEVHGSIANGYAYYGLWPEAKVHAEIAGQTWANWGLQNASRACEALAEWGPSERWVQEASQNYPTTSGYEWYFGCRRTGRGNESEALSLAEKYFSTESSRPTRVKQIRRGIYGILEGDAKSALAAYRKAQSFGPTFTCSFMIAQLARQLSDENMREKVLLEMAITSEQSKETEEFDEKVDSAGLAILELIKSGNASAERLEHIDDLLAKIGDNACSVFSYFVGTELHELGKSEEAEKYWRRALVLPFRDEYYATLAGSSLAKLHGTSRPENEALGKDDVWPARKEEGQPE